MEPGRVLGRSGLTVGPIGLGCWAIGGPFSYGGQPLGWGDVDDEESVRAIRRALELGVTFFDTADVYGAGHSERVLGRALADRRDDVVIATKFGNTFDERNSEVTGFAAEPGAIRLACEASLRRLGTDRIDLYQFHLSDYDPESAPVVRDALEELVAAGSIRAYAWSTDDPERARVFAAGTHCAAVQHELSVLHDAPAMLAVCDELALASVNRSPLAMGLLTGKFTADSRLPADDIRGQAPTDWLTYFRDGRPTPESLAPARRDQGNPHERGSEPGRGSAVLDPRSERPDDPRARLPYRRAGGAERRRGHVRATPSRPDPRDRPAPGSRVGPAYPRGARTYENR